MVLSHLCGQAEDLLHQLLGLCWFLQEQLDYCSQELQLHLKGSQWTRVTAAHLNILKWIPQICNTADLKKQLFSEPQYTDQIYKASIFKFVFVVLNIFNIIRESFLHVMKHGKKNKNLSCQQKKKTFIGNNMTILHLFRRYNLLQLYISHYELQLS